MSDTSLSTFVLSPCVASSIASSNVLHPVRRQHRPRNVPPPRLVPVQELKPFANAAHFSRLWSAWKVQQTQGLLLSVVNHVSTKSATFAAGNTRTLKEQKDHQRCSLIVTIEKSGTCFQRCKHVTWNSAIAVGRLHQQDADTRADVHNNVRVGVAKIKRFFHYRLSVQRILDRETLGVAVNVAVMVDVVNSWSKMWTNFVSLPPRQNMRLHSTICSSFSTTVSSKTHLWINSNIRFQTVIWIRWKAVC